jgi:hypothetical protein
MRKLTLVAEEADEPIATIDGQQIDWEAAAKIRRQAYEAYCNAGFLSKHALELCKIIRFG